MGKTVIVYCSTHHGNTKVLVDAIISQNKLTVIDCTVKQKTDLSEFDVIGFASGIAFGNYYLPLLNFIKENLPDNKDVFFIHTAGSPKENQNRKVRELCEKKGCKCVGTYYCKGFDTYGPFKLLGGINKGHPDKTDIANAVKFFNDL